MPLCVGGWVCVRAFCRTSIARSKCSGSDDFATESAFSVAWELGPVNAPKARTDLPGKMHGTFCVLPEGLTNAIAGPCGPGRLDERNKNTTQKY